ncbi:hypothetical protein ACS0TY_019697 [Phlomoides rotata]
MSVGEVPLILEWDFEIPAEDLRSPVTCKNMTATHYNVTRCYCEAGCEGNPYLPQGCQDIDECNINNTALNTCTAAGDTCINTVGSFICKRDDENRMKGTIIGLSSATGALNIRLFDAKELALATDWYNENRILGRGGQGTVYKGMLPDGRIVAVMKSKKVDEAEIVSDDIFPLSWKMRLRIATEIAEALSYLHYAALVPIYLRDIKSTKILLDEKYRAKVSDFGTSRSIAIDQTHLTTIVLGTFGYLDPEYFRSSQFTEKSDVYSFGVVMVELRTGEKAISAVNDESGRNLATHFLQAMKENNFFKILDQDIGKEGGTEDVTEVARLAMRCLNLNGKKRPTMREVAAVLEGIQMPKDGSALQYDSFLVRFMKIMIPHLPRTSQIAKASLHSR